MGFINSVSVAQSLHRSIVNRAVDNYGLSREQEIRKDQPLPSNALGYRVYLDNSDTLSRINREARELLEGSQSDLALELRRVYEDLKSPSMRKSLLSLSQ